MPTEPISSNVLTSRSNVPTGQAHALAKTFNLHAPGGTQREIDLRQTDGHAEVIFSLENNKFHPASGHLKIESLKPAQSDWFQVAGTAHRDFQSRETLDFRVLIDIPPDTPANTFEFTVVVNSETNPEQDFTVQEDRAITVDWAPIPQIKRIKLWQWALMILLPLALLGVGGKLLYDWFNPPQSLDALRRANQFAQAAVNEGAEKTQWRNYWDSCTIQGQHKLLYWMGYKLHEDADNPDWKGQLEQWLPSFGLTLTNLREFSSPPRQIRAYQATDATREMRREIESKGHSVKNFFVAAASWNQFDEQDFAAYEIRKGKGLLGPDEGKFSSLEKKRASSLQEFQFLPLAKQDVKVTLADRFASFVAVSFADLKDDDKTSPGKSPIYNAKNYFLLESSGETLVQDVETEKISDYENAKAALKKYRENAVLLTFFKVDGVWLIDDFYEVGNGNPAQRFLGQWMTLNEAPKTNERRQIQSLEVKLENSDQVQIVVAFKPTGQNDKDVDHADLVAGPSDFNLTPSPPENAVARIKNEFIIVKTGETSLFPIREYQLTSTNIDNWLILKDLSKTGDDDGTATDIHLWRTDGTPTADSSISRNLASPKKNIVVGMSWLDAKSVLNSFGYTNLIPRGNKEGDKVEETSVVENVLSVDQQSNSFNEQLLHEVSQEGELPRINDPYHPPELVIRYTAPKDTTAKAPGE